MRNERAFDAVGNCAGCDDTSIEQMPLSRTDSLSPTSMAPGSWHIGDIS
jgi:hypothetical protein